MKKIFLLPFFVCAVTVLPAQQVVIHPDLIAQQGRNTAYKLFWSERYNSTLQSIREHRSSTLGSMTAVEQIQQKIFKSLTQVEQGLQDGKTIWYISKRIPHIFSLFEEAAVLAAKKPFLLPMVSKEAELCYQRIGNLTQYLQEVLLTADETVLMDPAARAKFVHQMYEEVRVMEALGQHLVFTLQAHTLQDAIQQVVPYKDYIQMDRAIIEGILRQWKY
jgi:hypothetical protein